MREHYKKVFMTLIQMTSYEYCDLYYKGSIFCLPSLPCSNTMLSETCWTQACSRNVEGVYNDYFEHNNHRRYETDKSL